MNKRRSIISIIIFGTPLLVSSFFLWIGSYRWFEFEEWILKTPLQCALSVPLHDLVVLALLNHMTLVGS